MAAKLRPVHCLPPGRLSRALFDSLKSSFLTGDDKTELKYYMVALGQTEKSGVYEICIKIVIVPKAKSVTHPPRRVAGFHHSVADSIVRPLPIWHLPSI